MKPLHLVTGGSGFLGFKIAQALARRGERVRIFDTLACPDPSLAVEVQIGDVRNLAAVEKAMEGVDIVFHAAAQVPLTKAGKRFWEVNVLGTQNVLKAAQKKNTRFFIHVSSSAVYGIPKKFPLTEESPFAPAEIYGRSKFEADQQVMAAIRSGFKAAVVRPRTIVGLERLGIFEILFEWIREGRSIYVIGDGSNLFQFVHSDDLIDAILLMAEKQKAGDFNIGTDRYRTLKEDLEALIGHAKTSSKVKGLPAGPTISFLSLLDKLNLSPLAPWHYLTYHKPFYFDIRKAEQELGWKPRYSNEQMLCEAYDWYLKDFRENQNKFVSSHRKPVRKRVLGLLKKLS